MKSLNSVVACFLLIMYANLVRGGIPKTRSAPCIRGVEACMQGSGVTERRALINGFNAIKKLLVSRPTVYHAVQKSHALLCPSSKDKCSSPHTIR